MPTKPVIKKKRLAKKKVVRKRPAPATASKKKVVIIKKGVRAPALHPTRMFRIEYEPYMRRANISNTVKNALLLGATTAQCLSMIKRWFPESTLSASNVSQFRTTLRKEGFTPEEKVTTIKEIIGKKPS